jgi:hypothetical protein
MRLYRRPTPSCHSTESTDDSCWLPSNLFNGISRSVLASAYIVSCVCTCMHTQSAVKKRSDYSSICAEAYAWLTSIFSAPRTNHACFCMLRATLWRLAGIPSNTDPWPPTSAFVLLSCHWLKGCGKGACLPRVRLSRRWCNDTGNLVWGNAQRARNAWPLCARESSLRASWMRGARPESGLVKHETLG